MSISDRLAEIQARADNATHGPWELTLDGEVQGRRPGFRGADPEMDPIVGCLDEAEDNEFIAHARADVPWLIEQVRKRDTALRAVLDQVTEWRDESFSFFGGPVDEATSVRYECAQEVLAAVETALGEVAS